MSVTVNGNTYLPSADGKIYGQYPLGDAPSSNANVYVDSFESQDLTGSAATVDTGNFTWESSNTVNIVYQDGETPKSVWPAIFDGAGGNDWTAKDQTYSLLFDYSGGANQSEQRFSLDPVNEIWFRYWVRVPENFQHGNASPTNNKFFAIWMNAEADYSSGGEGSTVAWEFWNDGSGGSDISFHYSDNTYTVMGPHLQSTPFITYPNDQGRWMQVVVHVKAATTTESGDGVIGFYRRWEDEPSFTQLHYTNTADIGIPSGKAGWSWGYFMGYSNPAYTENTFWLVDSVEVSTESLL
jgi:hypothetical protein